MKFSQINQIRPAVCCPCSAWPLAAQPARKRAPEVVAETESGIDATTRRAQELAAEARCPCRRCRRTHCSSCTEHQTVFYFDFDVSEFRSSRPRCPDLSRQGPRREF